jgi:hypothetical protein
MNNELLKTLNFAHLAYSAAFAVLVCLKILINVKSAKNLEFIQITRSVKFTLDSSLLASLSGEASSTPVENVRQIRLFLQNKAKVKFYEFG